jgi:hypothetical protein
MKTLARLIGAGLALASTSGLAAAPAEQPAALVFTGRGAEIYSCQDTGSGYAWVLKGPEARLYNAAGQVVGHHFLGPKWEANDGSRIKGQVLVASPSPEARQRNVPWLVLRADVEQGTGIFGQVRIVTRTNTRGGAAPASACGPQQKDQTVNEPYSATYTFFSSPDKTASVP